MKMELLKGLIALLIFLGIIFLARRPGESSNCRHNRLFSNKEFDGVVITKEFNTSNHDNERIRLSSGQYFEWNDERYKDLRLYNQINEGDSISKSKGVYIIERYKLNKIDTFDLYLECNDK